MFVFYFLLQGEAPPGDGIGPPEEVSIASAEASIIQYVGLLAVTVAAGFFFASKAFKDGEVHWLPLLGTLVAGYLTYKGAFYLSLQNYVNTVQRPQSRVRSDTAAACACRFACVQSNASHLADIAIAAAAAQEKTRDFFKQYLP